LAERESCMPSALPCFISLLHLLCPYQVSIGQPSTEIKPKLT
jgi:hypothetical protein